MATTTKMSITKSQVVNDVVVLDYSATEYAEYLKSKKGAEEYFLPQPQMNNAIEGLRIMDVSVSCQSNMTRSPVETGVQIADSRVRMPCKISIKGICDNIRGEMKHDKKFVENRSGTGMIGAAKSMGFSVVDAFTGYEFSASQMIETRARSVYKKIHQMYTSKERVNGQPKTWTISTKGAVYPNMILRDVEQLNDWEHLMVIPVTLNFEELMMVGQDDKEYVFLADDDSPLQMSGVMKKGNIFQETWNGIKEAFS